MASPKIYFLKNKEEKFVAVVNGDIHFVKKMGYARFTRNFKEIEEKLIPYQALLGCELEIFQSTEEEFMEDLRHITTKAILVGNYFNQLLENINYNLPTISQVNKNLGKTMKTTIQHLQGVTSGFREFEKNHEDVVFEVYGYFMEMIDELAETDLNKSRNVTMMLRASKIDESSILGIVKKVINNNKK